jgi:hypothetical protein
MKLKQNQKKKQTNKQTKTKQKTNKANQTSKQKTHICTICSLRSYVGLKYGTPFMPDIC